MRKQNGNANNLQVQGKEENFCSKRKRVLEENAGFPSLLSPLPNIPRRKRTTIKRSRPTLPPKDINGESNDENERIRRQGWPFKHQVATSGVDPRTSLNKNEPNQLQPRTQAGPLLPLSPPQTAQPQPWPTESPTWLQLQPFTNIGSSGAYHVEYKGKQVVVDDRNNDRKKLSSGNNLDSLFGNQKGGIKILDESNENVGTGSVIPGDLGFLNQSNPMKTGTLQANQRKNVKSKAIVHPSKYVRQTRNCGSQLSMGGATSSVQSSTLMQGMQPPPLRDDQGVWIQETAQPLQTWGGQSWLIPNCMKVQVQEPPQPLSKGGPLQLVPDSPALQLQKCAEAIYGEEVFSDGEPPVVGLYTAMMVGALNPNYHEALKALLCVKQSPPLSSPKTTTTTTTITPSQQFLPPPPAFTVSGHDATGQQELELALPSSINSNANMFVQPTYGTIQQQPVDMVLPQQHQVPPQLASNQFLFDRDLFQQKSNLFMQMPMQPQMPPQMTMFGVPNFPWRYLQGYPGSSSEGTFGFRNCGYQGYPPPDVDKPNSLLERLRLEM